MAAAKLVKISGKKKGCWCQFLQQSFSRMLSLIRSVVQAFTKKKEAFKLLKTLSKAMCFSPILLLPFLLFFSPFVFVLVSFPPFLHFRADAPRNVFHRISSSKVSIFPTCIHCQAFLPLLKSFETVSLNLKKDLSRRLFSRTARIKKSPTRHRVSIIAREEKGK